MRDVEGRGYTVRYEAVNAMLLNEFLKEHRKVQDLESTIEKQQTTISQLKSTAAKGQMTDAEQQKEIEALAASLREQASQIQKISAQVELQKATAQTVANSPNQSSAGGSLEPPLPSGSITASAFANSCAIICRKQVARSGVCSKLWCA